MFTKLIFLLKIMLIGFVFNECYEIFFVLYYDTPPFKDVFLLDT